MANVVDSCVLQAAIEVEGNALAGCEAPTVDAPKQYAQAAASSLSHMPPNANVSGRAYDGPENAVSDFFFQALPEWVREVDDKNRATLADVAQGRSPHVDPVLPGYGGAVSGVAAVTFDAQKALIAMGRPSTLRNFATRNAAEELARKAVTDPQAPQKLLQMAVRGKDGAISAADELFRLKRFTELGELLASNAASAETVQLFVIRRARTYSDAAVALEVLQAAAGAKRASILSEVRRTAEKLAGQGKPGFTELLQTLKPVASK